MGSPIAAKDRATPTNHLLGVIAPHWQDPAFSVFDGSDDTPEGRIRNMQDARRFNEMRQPGYSYMDAVLGSLDVAVAGGYNANVLYELPDDFGQLINPAIRGLAKADVHVVVSAGGNKEGQAISSPNAVIHPYIAYEDILPRAQVFVTKSVAILG